MDKTITNLETQTTRIGLMCIWMMNLPLESAVLLVLF